MIIFSPYKAIFNEKNNILPFGPVCSKYAAVCSNPDFFPMSTPSRFFQHIKLALFPNFGALFLKITSGSHTAWTSYPNSYFPANFQSNWTKIALVIKVVFE